VKRKYLIIFLDGRKRQLGLVVKKNTALYGAVFFPPFLHVSNFLWPGAMQTLLSLDINQPADLACFAQSPHVSPTYSPYPLPPT
jgi:hypothetical protein